MSLDRCLDMLRDRLVCGINNDHIQRRLLGEVTLTFKKALEIAHAMETAAINSKDIQAANASVPQCTVHCLFREAGGGKPMKSVVTGMGERILLMTVVLKMPLAITARKWGT